MHFGSSVECEIDLQAERELRFYLLGLQYPVLAVEMKDGAIGLYDKRAIEQGGDCFR